MIRAATIDDVPAICDMAERFWATTRYDDPFDFDSVADMAAHCIEQGIMLILEVDGVVAGFCCAVIGGLLGNRNVKVSTEIAYYVYPEHRKGRHGIDLIDGLESESKAKGCKYCNMAVMLDAAPEVAEKIYQSRGYQPNECLWTRVL